MNAAARDIYGDIDPSNKYNLIRMTYIRNEKMLNNGGLHFPNTPFRSCLPTREGRAEQIDRMRKRFARTIRYREQEQQISRRVGSSFAIRVESLLR